MSELFLHPVVSGTSISDIYRRACAEASELHVLSAYLRTWDTGLKINDKCEIFSSIVGKDFGITRKDACRNVSRNLVRPLIFAGEERNLSVEIPGLAVMTLDKPSRRIAAQIAGRWRPHLFGEKAAMRSLIRDRLGRRVREIRADLR